MSRHGSGPTRRKRSSGVRTRSAAAELSLVVLVSACSSALGPVRNDLATARASWAAMISAPYSFTFARSCFCASEFLRPVHISVADGEVTQAVFVDTGDPVATPLSEIETVDDLFDEIQAAIDADAFEIVATFDSRLGYPVSVSIDYIENAIDDEMAFQVSDFHEPLTTPQTSQLSHAGGRSPK